MSETHPPEQPSFNRPAGSQPTTPLPSGQPGTPPAGPSASPPPPPPGGASAAAGVTPAGGSSGWSALPDPGREGAGFFTALFDFTFTSFVTPILVRFVYLLATVALAAMWLLFLFAAFADSLALGLVVLVLGPVLLVISLAVVRMTLEFYLSVVRMSEDIHKRLPRA